MTYWAVPCVRYLVNVVFPFNPFHDGVSIKHMPAFCNHWVLHDLQGDGTEEIVWNIIAIVSFLRGSHRFQHDELNSVINKRNWVGDYSEGFDLNPSKRTRRLLGSSLLI